MPKRTMNLDAMDAEEIAASSINVLRALCKAERLKAGGGKGNARWVWQPVSVGAQTHSLDTAVYAAAAGYYKRAFYWKDPAAKLRRAAGAGGGAKRARRVGRMER